MWINLTDSGLGGGIAGTVLHVNSSNVFQYGLSSSSSTGSTLQVTGPASQLLHVQESPIDISEAITDGNWLGLVPGWIGAPAGLVYVNMDNVLYFKANLPTNHVPTGTTLYWTTVDGNYQVANTPDEVAENSKRRFLL